MGYNSDKFRYSISKVICRLYVINCIHFVNDNRIGFFLGNLFLLNISFFNQIKKKTLPVVAHEVGKITSNLLL